MFAARLLVGEFVTGHEVSGGVGTPVVNKEIQGIQVGGESRSAWVVDYRDQAGTRRLKTFASKREAEAWAVEALHEVARGVHTPASASITVAVCFQRWIEHCEAEGLEFGTIRQRRQHLRLHVEPFIGREKLSELTAPQLYEFLDRLRSAGRSVAMRRKVLTNLKTAIGHAQTGPRGPERRPRRPSEVFKAAHLRRSAARGG
jgi:hypothetical protein